MEITKEMLIQSGIDPALYSKSDITKIGDAAEKMKDVGISETLAALDLNMPNEDELRANATQAIQFFNGLFEQMKAHLDSLASLCSVKTSIFSDELSEKEKKVILDGAGELISKINALGEEGLNTVGRMFRLYESLYKIRDAYNRLLYEVGLLNVAATVLEIESDEIFDVIETAFDKFSSITAFVNDLNDRAIICEEAIELKLNPSLAELLDAIDYENDGEKLSTKKIISTASAIKIMLADVIER